MVKRDFGTNKVLYTVYEKPEGDIEIHVFSENQVVRRIISNHTTDGVFFVINQDRYAKEDTAAKQWLSKIVEEYRDKFMANRVLFVLRGPTSNLPPPRPHKQVITNDVEITKQNPSKCSSLIDFGFMDAGFCILSSRVKSGVKYIVEKYKKDRTIYAFCVDGELKYIGVCDNTKTCFNDRMKRYQGMVGKGTNKRVTIQIKECLNKGNEVSIWAMKPDEEIPYKDVLIDLIKGLENPLIQKFKPEWNIKG